MRNRLTAILGALLLVSLPASGFAGQGDYRAADGKATNCTLDQNEEPGGATRNPQATGGGKKPPPVMIQMTAVKKSPTMPKLEGLTLAQANLLLLPFGRPPATTRIHAASPAGIVVNQVPSPGTLVNCRTQVTVSVSEGPAPTDGGPSTISGVLGGLFGGAKQSAEADLAVTATNDSPSSHIAGGAIQFTVMVMNLGPATATRVTLRNVAINLNTVQSSLTCAGFPCRIQNLLPGQSMSFRVSARIGDSGGFQDDLSVSALEDDPQRGNNQAEISGAATVATPVIQPGIGGPATPVVPVEPADPVIPAAPVVPAVPVASGDDGLPAVPGTTVTEASGQYCAQITVDAPTPPPDVQVGSEFTFAFPVQCTRSTDRPTTVVLEGVPVNLMNLYVEGACGGVSCEVSQWTPEETRNLVVHAAAAEAGPYGYVLSARLRGPGKVEGNTITRTLRGSAAGGVPAWFWWALGGVLVAVLAASVAGLRSDSWRGRQEQRWITRFSARAEVAQVTGRATAIPFTEPAIEVAVSMGSIDGRSVGAVPIVKERVLG